MARKTVAVLGLAVVLQGLLMLCFVSALQIQVPRNMPFGVVGSSPVVGEVATKTSLQPIPYANQAAALRGVNQSRVYGAYVTGSARDTLIVVPAKSFFGQVEVEGLFTTAAQKLHRPITVQNAKPLPSSDPVGGVVGLLLLPLLIGGFVAAVFVFKAAHGTAAAPWRAAILIGYSFVGALLTDLIAGPGIGAYSNSHFWPLLGCFTLVTSAVALVAAAIQGVMGRVGTVVVVIFFIILGGSSGGGSGLSLLPSYWQYIGETLPPQNAVTLIRNVLYFGGNNITVPLIALSLYALAGIAVIGYLGRIRPARVAAARAPSELAEAGASATTTESTEAAASANPSGSADAGASANPSPTGRRAIIVALAATAVIECLFAFTYMSAGHQPVATNMPIGVTRPSAILTKVQQQGYSLKVTKYPNAIVAKQAIAEAKIQGAVVPTGIGSTLIVVPSASALSPLDLAAHFERAAREVGLPLRVIQYQPTPLAKKDPFGIVIALMMFPLLLPAYLGATLLKNATGAAAGRWRVLILTGFAIVVGLSLDLIVCIGLQGYPRDKFWIVWPILSFVTAAIAFLASMLEKLLGAVGTFLTINMVVMFGNPSSGGANGVPYLPTFWRDIGPYLPARNAYTLLHNTIYFSGHNITQPLLVLSLYAGVTAIVLGFLDWFRTPRIPVPPDTEEEAAGMMVPIGGPA